MNTAAWLTGRQGQGLAVGIGVLALVLVWFGVVDPVWSWFDDRTLLLEQRQALLERMRGIAATLPRMRAETAAKPAQGDETGTLLLPGATDAVAAADLQERIQKMASAAGANLTAVETLPATVSGQWHRVSLRISLNAPWPVLMDLLRAIDESNTRILVDDVHFHSATLVSRPVVLPIQASMVVYGFRPAGQGTGS
jgi:type II secretory pathway component PulM